jgi:hypothetical protein
VTRRALVRFGRDQGGAAAIEFAGVAVLLVFGALNTAELGRYAFQASDVAAAAQSGAEAAAVACDVDHVPATLNCPGLQTAVTVAVESSRLGSYVQLNGPITEAYYCRTTTGSLGKAGDVGAKPADCSGVANAAGGATPALYLQVDVLYIYRPMFTGLTIAQDLNPYVTRIAWMRMA